MRCSNCGSTIGENAKFCGQCGAPVFESSQKTDNISVDENISPNLDSELLNNEEQIISDSEGKTELNNSKQEFSEVLDEEVFVKREFEVSNNLESNVFDEDKKEFRDLTDDETKASESSTDFNNSFDNENFKFGNDPHKEYVNRENYSNSSYKNVNYSDGYAPNRVNSTGTNIINIAAIVGMVIVGAFALFFLFTNIIYIFFVLGGLF